MNSVRQIALAALFFWSTPLSAQASGPTTESNASPTKVADLCQKARQQQDKYLEIWKGLLIKRSGMEREYLNRQIQITSAEMECQWIGGISLRVSFTVRYDWAEIEQQDQLLVLLYSEYDAYRHLSFKRDHFFDEVEIPSVMAVNILSESTLVKPHANLKFSTEAEALQVFQSMLGGNKPENVQLSFYVPGKLPRVDGDPYMLGSATVDMKSNKCLSGYLNLVTGKSEAHETACRFY